MKNKTLAYLTTSVALIAIVCSFGCSHTEQIQSKLLHVPVEFTLNNTASQSALYVVDSIIESCIMIYTTNPGQNSHRLLHKNSQFSGLPGASALALSKLNGIEVSTDSTIYNFGIGCGDASEYDPSVVSVNNAQVIVTYLANEPSDINFNEPTTPVRINIEQSLFVGDEGNSNTYSDQEFLLVEASKANPATIRILKENGRGKVKVVIYRSTGKPKPLIVMDPKSESLQEFITDQNVYVIPFIIPQSSETALVSQYRIWWDVGDPVENGELEVDEDQ